MAAPRAVQGMPRLVKTSRQPSTGIVQTLYEAHRLYSLTGPSTLGE
jgi:hypothetical protein